MSQLNGPARFRQLLKKPGYIQALGVWDPLSARVCESMGIECVHIGGYQAGVGTAISEPLMTLTELATLCHYVTSAVKIPVFVDAGTGFGEHLPGQRQHAADMVARGQFGHHATVIGMQRGLRMQGVGQKAARAVVERDASFVAGGFDPQNQHFWVFGW